MSKSSIPEGPNPSGLCMCGCGGRTTLSPQSSRSTGHVKGTPVRYLPGHNAFPARPQYLVDSETGCWVWQWSRTAKGYAHIERSGFNQMAHRAYYERANGPIPKGVEIHHTCGNPSCVNPDHLEPMNASGHLRAHHRVNWKQRALAAESKLAANGL